MVGPGLIGRVEVSGFSRRLERSDDDPGRVWAQMQGSGDSGIGIGTTWPSGVVRGAIARSSRWLTKRDVGFFRSIVAVRLNCRISTRPRRYDSAELRALVLVGPIRVEPVRAAARVGIDQCCLQIVLAQKPIERPHRARPPLCAAIHLPRRKAGGNRCCCFHRLLIEGFRILAYLAEAVRSRPA